MDKEKKNLSEGNDSRDEKISSLKKKLRQKRAVLNEAAEENFLREGIVNQERVAEQLDKYYEATEALRRAQTTAKKGQEQATDDCTKANKSDEDESS